MRILITGPHTDLGQALAERLSPDHEVVLAPAADDLMRPESAAPLLQGVEAVAHLAEYEPGQPSSPPAEGDLLERAARGTFVLAHEALKAGVGRIVVASRLELMTDHPAECVADESWRPHPRTDAASLAPWMAELTLREFARAEALHGIALRMSPALTRPEHALAALERALTMELPERGYRWRLYHIDSTGRFPAAEAGKAPLALTLE
jgi:nucleoside-diphosphate-sugar epimerase